MYLGKFCDSPPFKKKFKICGSLAPFLRAFARYAPPHAPRASSRLRWLPLARVCSRWLALLRAVSRWLALARACFPALARASLHWLALARAGPQSLATPLGRAMACSPVPPPPPFDCDRWRVVNRARSSVATHTRKWQTRRDGCPKLRKQVGVKRGTAGRESLKTVAPKPQQNNRSHRPTTSWQHCDPPTSLHGFRMTSRRPTRAKSGRGRACAWVL